MPGHRLTHALLLAFSILVAPLASVRAAGAPCAADTSESHAIHMLSGGKMAAAQDAPDAHCDEDSHHCPPEFCAAKCFPTMEHSSFAQTNPRISAIDLQRDEPTRLRASPGRRDQRPPRT
ncbi:MAG TPA: hypothetical protein VLA28_00690 [Afifellaceae bacterium]|nr:hypothetical protein [Afifellaceae bacterium]